MIIEEQREDKKKVLAKQIQNSLAAITIEIVTIVNMACKEVNQR